MGRRHAQLDGAQDVLVRGALAQHHLDVDDNEEAEERGAARAQHQLAVVAEWHEQRDEPRPDQHPQQGVRRRGERGKVPLGLERVEHEPPHRNGGDERRLRHHRRLVVHCDEPHHVRLGQGERAQQLHVEWALVTIDHRRNHQSERAHHREHLQAGMSEHERLDGGAADEQCRHHRRHEQLRLRCGCGQSRRRTVPGGCGGGCVRRRCQTLCGRIPFECLRRRTAREGEGGNVAGGGGWIERSVVPTWHLSTVTPYSMSSSSDPGLGASSAGATGAYGASISCSTGVYLFSIFYRPVHPTIALSLSS